MGGGDTKRHERFIWTNVRPFERDVDDQLKLKIEGRHAKHLLLESNMFSFRVSPMNLVRCL